jgi:hypothetical protein
MFELSYAGVSLCVPDPGTRDRVDRMIPFCDLRDVQPPARWPGKNLRGVAWADPTAYPEPRVGQLFWPCGASRWAVGRFLATGEMVGQIQSQMLAGDYEAADLVLQADSAGVVDAAKATSTSPPLDAVPTSITAEMYLLPPRPLAGIVLDTAATGTERDLYLLTLVDVRYFWQWVTVTLGDSGAGYGYSGSSGYGPSPLTWAEAFTACQGVLSISPDPINLDPGSIDSKYGYVEPDSALFDNEENAALVLDALLANTGRVLVAKYDGAFRVKTIKNNRDSVKTERDRWKGVRTAGGPVLNLSGTTPDSFRKAVLPQTVQVTFPQWVNDKGYWKPDTQYRSWILDSYNGVFTEQVDMTALTDYSQYVGTSLTWTKTFHDTAKATYPNPTAVENETNPGNETQLKDLAEQLAKDYADGLISRLDEMYPGVLPWAPDGLNDVLVTYLKDTAWTRVQGRPFNHGVTEMQHGFGPLESMEVAGGTGTTEKNIRILGPPTNDGNWNYYPGIIQKDFDPSATPPWIDEDSPYTLEGLPINCWVVYWYTYFNVVGIDGNSAAKGRYESVRYDPPSVALGVELPVYSDTAYSAVRDVNCSGDPLEINENLGG